MIIGGAAFQGIWDSKSTRELGFNPSHQDTSPPELDDLTKYIQRELLNRFASEIFVLPQLKKSDYEAMIHMMAPTISETWRAKFIELGLANLDRAVKHQKGARYAEEIILSAIVSERSLMSEQLEINLTETQNESAIHNEDFGIC